MKKRLLVSTVVASLIMGTVALSANSDVTSTSNIKKSVQNSNKVLRIQKSINHEVKAQKEHFKQTSKEIMDGLKETFLATKALENNKIDEAKKSLKLSVKLFETALKADPSLGLISIAQEINVNIFSGDAKELQHYLDATIELLKKHDTQEAREMLLPLEDEMVISTQQLPIDTYLSSTKVALKLLESNKKEEALLTLNTGLSLMKVDIIVMPIPLILSENLIVEASVLDKSKKEEAQKLLSMAQDELQKAVLLGYTQKHEPEYKILSENISEIQKEIKSKNVVEKLYDKVKTNIHNLINKHRDDVIQDKAQKKIQAYQNREAKKALDESKKFTADAKKDENKTIK